MLWRVLKFYGNHTGRRFATVETDDGSRIDVLIRGPRDGSTPNAWGDFYPFEETRKKMILVKAGEPIQRKANPGKKLTMFPNEKPKRKTNLKKKIPIFPDEMFPDEMSYEDVTAQKPKRKTSPKKKKDMWETVPFPYQVQAKEAAGVWRNVAGFSSEKEAVRVAQYFADKYQQQYRVVKTGS